MDGGINIRRSRNQPLDPEKWDQVFGLDHAQTKLVVDGRQVEHSRSHREAREANKDYGDHGVTHEGYVAPQRSNYILSFHHCLMLR